MKLDCVVSSCNLNPLYSEFIPIFIRTWKLLYPNVDVKIILISHILPTEYDIFSEHIILFPPLPDISTSLTSQYIRLLYPCILNYENGILITDIDMLPMNSTYFTDNIARFDNSKFVYLRNVCFEYHEISMCYNVGLRQTWSEIFNIHTLEDIKKHLHTVNVNNKYLEGHGNIGWNTDQRDLFKYVNIWNEQTNNFVFLNDTDTRFARLDRSHNFIFNMTEPLQKAIKAGFFCDYHCLRPYSQYKQINEFIVSLLSQSI